MQPAGDSVVCFVSGEVAQENGKEINARAGKIVRDNEGAVSRSSLRVRGVGHTLLSFKI
jgi:hypothetical protein